MPEYPIEPVSAPRQVRSDVWNPSPSVLKYRSFRDEVRLRAVIIPVPCDLIFFISMPASWSQKKKLAMNGQPHTQKPDLDNLCKALFDSVFESDSQIWKFRAEKRWRITPGILIQELI